MAYSYVQYTGDGSTTSYTFSFTGQDQGYLRNSDIEVTVDDVSASFTFLSSNSIEFDNAPANGSTIIIRRVMPKSETYADFQRGNNFGQEVLNNSFLQLLYVVHELLDGWFPEGFTVREAVTYLEGLRSFEPDPNDPDSVVTFGSGDARFVNIMGDVMQGDLDMSMNPVYVRKAVTGNEPARKDELDSAVSGYQSADANIQGQLTGNIPLESSAFSPISWHDKVIENSVTIPENKNAWSFGPVLTIESGQDVTISEGSHWTIAEGNTEEFEGPVQGGGSIENYDEGEI